MISGFGIYRCRGNIATMTNFSINPVSSENFHLDPIWLFVLFCFVLFVFFFFFLSF